MYELPRFLQKIEHVLLTLTRDHCTTNCLMRSCSADLQVSQFRWSPRGRRANSMAVVDTSKLGNGGVKLSKRI